LNAKAGSKQCGASIQFACLTDSTGVPKASEGVGKWSVKLEAETRSPKTSPRGVLLPAS